MESDKSLYGEKNPKFKDLIARLHFETWKDRPDNFLDEEAYASGKESSSLPKELEFNKRRTAWFGAVLGTIELLGYAMEDGNADKEDLEKVERVKGEIKK